MLYDLSKLTLEEKIGQMLGFAFSGTTYDEELAFRIKELNAGLLIYFKDNCDNPKQIFELNQLINQNAKIPPFIALDQEGGMVARVTTKVTQSPGAMAISAGSTYQDAYQLAYNMGVELRSLGFNFNFAPEGDVNNNPLNPVINVRSYSDDPYIVAEYMTYAAKGYSDALMMTSVKHFPGHGDTAVDSHIGLPVVDFDEERLNKIELVPFKKAIKEQLPGIMASHVMYTHYDPIYPTSLSYKIIQKCLRDQMGFNGLVVTDSLTMNAIWGRFSIEEIVLNGFNSGCDILLFCGDRNLINHQEIFDTAVRLVKEGKIDIEQVNRAVTRILKYKTMFKCGEMASSFNEIKNELAEESRVEFAQKVANRSITLLKDENHLLPITSNERILVVFPIIKVVTLVENADNTLNSLGDFLPFTVDKHYISIDPTANEQATLLAKIKNYDKIIYCSYNACFNLQQALLINSLDQDKLIVVAIRTPYDQNVLNTKTYLCSYEASSQAFIALAKVLTGQIQATGKMPVKL